MNYSRRPLILPGVFAAMLSLFTGCKNDAPPASSPATAATGSSGRSAQGTSAGTPGSAASGVTGAIGSAGSSATNPGTNGATKPNTAGGSATTGASAAAGVSAAAGSGNVGGAGAPNPTGKLAPSTRNPKYASLAPPMGEPIPSGMPGMWTWLAVDGALSRDGSPAGFYYKFSKTGSKNLLIYLAGGGVCADNFFCNMNPPNKDSSLTAENVGAGVFNIFGPTQEAQDPTLERWQSGIFKDDPANPAHDWNMVFIPYVTGDIFFGSKPDGTIPEVEGSKFQFVGKSNMQKFIGRITPTFKDAQIVVLAGSSAGGIGALLNSTYVFDAFIDQGNGARGFVLDDAGPFFDDPYIEVCMQKRYRDLYGLDESMPTECAGCKSADGGHIAAGLLSYLFDKYPDNVLGGLVDSDQDEIMKFFFSEGLENCGYIDNPIVGLLAYPEDRYPMALTNLLTQLVDPKRLSSYIWSGDLHQNVFQTATDDRFYQKNGLEKSVAEWFATLMTGQAERIGVIK
jgi:hypothetical protein